MIIKYFFFIFKKEETGKIIVISFPSSKTNLFIDTNFKFRNEISIGGKLELKSDYNCFKLLGYDILLDEKLNPHLIEINARKLFSADTSLIKP